MTIDWEAAVVSDTGRMRSGNEDAYHLDSRRGIFIVADGMGGHAAGEVASRLSASAVAETLAGAVDDEVSPGEIDRVLASAMRLARARITACCEEDRATTGMGTTLTCCILSRDGTCHIGHIGDSRLYRLRDERLEPLTHDHTWVQEEVDAGRLTPSEASRHRHSHVLTRVLSSDTPSDADYTSERVEPGDLLLLCTDGLYNMLSDERIQTILSTTGALSSTLDALVDAANLAGGADNITVIAIRIL